MKNTNKIDQSNSTGNGRFIPVHQDSSEFFLRIGFQFFDNICLMKDPMDFRSGIDRFATCVQVKCDLSPYSQALFVFTNKQHNKIKAIYYDGTGFWLLYKRQGKGRFKWVPSSFESDFCLVDHEQLVDLLAGKEIFQTAGFQVKTPLYI